MSYNNYLDADAAYQVGWRLARGINVRCMNWVVLPNLRPTRPNLHPSIPWAVCVRLRRALVRHCEAHQPLRRGHALGLARGLPAGGRYHRGVECGFRGKICLLRDGESGCQNALGARAGGAMSCDPPRSHPPSTLPVLAQVRADPISAFGGIVAFNRPVDEVLAKEIREFRWSL